MSSITLVEHDTEGATAKKPLDERYLRKNGGNLGGDKPSWLPFSSAKWTRYQQTKLANVVFTYALRDRQDKVKALVAHPGLSATNLQVTTAQDGGMGHGFTDWLMGNMAQSAEDGAVGLITCCCVPDVKSGDFYGPKSISGACVLMPPGPDEAFADVPSRDMLWQTSLEVTGATYPF